MDMKENVFNDGRIEQIFIDLINEYGTKLPNGEKQIARQLFQKLHSQGKTWEWIYWAIWQLGDRKVVNNQGLFFYADYQREVSEICKNAHEYHFWKDYTLERCIDDVGIMIECEKDKISEERYKKLDCIESKYWDWGEELTEEDKEEIVQYFVDRTKDELRITRQEYEKEQRAIAKEVRRTLGKIVDVPPHPYVDMQFYKTEPTEEQKKMGLQLGFYKE